MTMLLAISVKKLTKPRAIMFLFIMDIFYSFFVTVYKVKMK
ncbi:hypothetical protein MNB_SV-8-166 [hydrothermal vent metagenome]|uniref:Uncharacterized protein n=1 Tax=hydrothermal vent metagenome TaxID=652676 RepID=A0A1W1CAU5_9ZZZZ